MSVVAIVVTHNRQNMLQQCISRLEAQTYSCDILVIDNDSKDQTFEWLQNHQMINEHLYICHLDNNIGGAGGFNYGIREGIKRNYDFLWLMDDDCLPETNALEKLMEADQLLGGEKYGFLTSTVLWTDGKECKMNRQKIRKKYFERVELLKHGIIQVEQSTFVSIMFPATTVLQVGLPIKEFFIWGDDIEYTRRIAVRRGIPSYMVGKSQVIHAMEKNDGSNIATDSLERINRYNYAFRNENYLYRQEGISGLLYYVAKCLLNVLRILTKAQNHRILRIMVILRQFLCGFFFNPKIEFIQKKE